MRGATTLLTPALAWGLALTFGAIVGCQDPPSAGPGAAASGSASNASPSATSLASAASAAPTASAAAKHPLGGAWKGKVEVSKAEVGVPEGVPYAVWKDEKGDVAAGDVEIALTVLDNGAVKGKAEGALGELTIMGAVIDQALTASLQPTDPNREGAMTGTLIAEVSGDAIAGDLRAASADGTVVRGGKVSLKRAP